MSYQNILMKNIAKINKPIEVANMKNNVEQLKLFDFIKSANLLLSFFNLTLFASCF